MFDRFRYLWEEYGPLCILVPLFLVLVILIICIIIYSKSNDELCAEACTGISGEMIQQNKYGCICNVNGQRIVLSGESNNTPVFIYMPSGR